MDSARLLDVGRAALAREGAAVSALAEQLDERFVKAAETILACPGHVVVSGAGTSAAVAWRLSHLLIDVSAPAFYLDAGESTHGAAATVRSEDVLLAISKGGETQEVNHLARVAGASGAKVICITESEESTLAGLSDIVLCIHTDEEVEGHGVIAMGSSLAAAAVGDALCFAVLAVRGYDEVALARAHPGGAVGRKLRQQIGQDRLGDTGG